MSRDDAGRTSRAGAAAVAMSGLALACAACGDNLAAPAMAADAGSTCTATFSGNFAESSTTAANCPTLAAAGTLGFALPSGALGVSFAISIELGPEPAPGVYTSETVADWSATATRRIGNGACEYSAGGSAVPSGSFSLMLGSVGEGSVHGALVVTQYVLTAPGTDCGDPDTEGIAATF